jgi:hypothetical protein
LLLKVCSVGAMGCSGKDGGDFWSLYLVGHYGDLPLEMDLLAKFWCWVAPVVCAGCSTESQQCTAGGGETD